MSENYVYSTIKNKSCHHRNLCMEFRFPSVCVPLCGASAILASAANKMDANDAGNSHKRSITLWRCRRGSEKRQKGNRDEEVLAVNSKACASQNQDQDLRKRYEQNAAENHPAGNRDEEICKTCLEGGLTQPWESNLSCGTHGCSACDKIHKGLFLMLKYQKITETSQFQNIVTLSNRKHLIALLVEDVCKKRGTVLDEVVCYTWINKSGYFNHNGICILFWYNCISKLTINCSNDGGTRKITQNKPMSERPM